MNLSKDYSNVAILSHYWKRHKSGIAPIDVTRDYFLPKVKRLLTIEHPFPSSGNSESIINFYEDGVLKKSYVYNLPNTGNYLPYIWHVLVTIYVMIKFIRLRFEIIIAINNLLVFSVIWLKLFGRVNNLIYYTIDYLENRFGNKLVNYIYHSLDKFACKLADKTWVVVERQIEVRKNKKIINDLKKISVVPMAFDQSKHLQTRVSNIDMNRIVYVGTLLEKQGIQIIIDSLPILIRRFKNISLHIIGFGDYEDKLKEQVSRLKLSNQVKFYGYIGDKEQIDKILSYSAVGVATYVPNSDNFTYFADPSKVKVYLSCGLPVLLTDVPALATTIAKTKSGIVVDYKVDSVVSAITSLLTNTKAYQMYKKAAISLGKSFGKELVLGKAISEL